jgi:hypothetical protein
MAELGIQNSVNHEHAVVRRGATKRLPQRKDIVGIDGFNVVDKPSWGATIGPGMCLKKAENRPIDQRRNLPGKGSNQLIDTDREISLLRVEGLKPLLKLFNSGDHVLSEPLSNCRFVYRRRSFSRAHFKKSFTPMDSLREPTTVGWLIASSVSFMC